MNPEFWLSPWDKKRPRHDPPRADLVVEHAGKTWLLRVCNGLLFARDAARNEENWTFVADDSIPDSFVDEADLIEKLWKDFVDAARIARYALYEHDTFYERPFPLFFRADGSGWCREAWNRDDLPFQHSVSAHEWMEAPAPVLATYGPQIYDDHLNEQLENLQFDVPARDLDWLCGSADELSQVTKWICALESGLWEAANRQEIEVYYQAESEFFRAGVETVRCARRFSASFHFDEHTGQRQFARYGKSDLRLTRRFLTLSDLAVDYNTPTGYYWEYHDQGAGRTANSPYSHDFELKIEAPSAHEQIEAPIRLREWLRGKVPESQIESLLSDEFLADVPPQPKPSWMK